MTYVKKHQEQHGHSSHATRGLDFLEAVAPKLGVIASPDHEVTTRDRLLMATCASAIPSYVEDLSNCFGMMVAARRALMLILDRQDGGCENYTSGPQSCYPDRLDVSLEGTYKQTCDACVAHRALYGEDPKKWPVWPAPKDPT